MILAAIKKIVPGPAIAKSRRWARENLPSSVQARLKSIERRLEGGGGQQQDLIARKDAMIQLMEQRIEALESMVFEKFDALERSWIERDVDLIKRQDSVLSLFDQRIAQIGHELRGLVQAESAPLLSDEQYRRLQDSYHHPETRGRTYRDLIDRFIPLGGVTLDLGCGTGEFIDALHHAGRTGRGVDLSPRMVQACRERGLEVVRGDAVAHLCSLEPNSLTAVTCLHVVEHLPNVTLAELVPQVFRVMRPGGVFVIDTPKTASLLDLTQHYFVDPTHRMPRHHDLFRFLLEGAGFTDVTVEDVPTGERLDKLTLDLAGDDDDDDDPLPAIDPTRGEPDPLVLEIAGGAEAAREQSVMTAAAVSPDRDRGPVDRLQARLDRLTGVLTTNFNALNEWLYVARDVRLVGRKPVQSSSTERMKTPLAIFSPLPPVRSGTADYCYEQLKDLARDLSITVVVERNADRVVPLPAGVEAVDCKQWLADEPRDRATPRLYHIGNNIHHEYALEQLLRRPGLVLLHDFVLHHLIVEMTLARGDQKRYRQFMEHDHGDLGVEVARQRSRYVFSEYQQFLMPLNRTVLDAAEGVVVHSRWAERRIRQSHPTTPVCCIPHHYAPPVGAAATEDRSTARRRIGMPADKLIIAALGFVTPPKRVDMTIKALGRIRDRMPPFELWIVGEVRDPPKLERLLAEHALTEHTHTTGYVALEDLERAINGSDLIVNLRYPTAGESSGTLVRALGTGRPTVIFDYASFTDIPGSVAKKIPLSTQDTAPLEAALLELGTNQGLRRSMGEQAAAYVQSAYALPRCAAAYSRFIHEVLGELPAALPAG